LIFVVTGVHKHGFNRLVKAVDDLTGQQLIKNAFIQTGFSTYQPKHCQWTKAMDFQQFEQRMDQADIIITHGGAGCIAGTLERNKPAIVVPRLKKYNEHNNDHQLELTSVLEKSGRVLAVYDIKNLFTTIEKASKFKPSPAVGNSKIVEIVRNFLVETAKKRTEMLKSSGNTNDSIFIRMYRCTTGVGNPQV